MKIPKTGRQCWGYVTFQTKEKEGAWRVGESQVAEGELHTQGRRSPAGPLETVGPGVSSPDAWRLPD